MVNLITKCILITFSFVFLGCSHSDETPENNEVVITEPVDSEVPEGEPLPSEHIVIETQLISSSVSHSCNVSMVNANSGNQQLSFTEISNQIGLDYTHSMIAGDGVFGQSGGVAAGDFDMDGWVDLYAVGGSQVNNLLLRNKGNGSFEQAIDYPNLLLRGEYSGPSFGDFNGDGWLDLFIGSVNQTSPKLFMNISSDEFVDITSNSQLVLPGNNFSATWGDYDRDNDIDLFVTHWTRQDNQNYAFLWRNNGDNTFTDVTNQMNLKIVSLRDKSFSPSFVDINNDGWQDILVVADGGNSRVLINHFGESFEDIKDDVISEKSGMGSAIGDYDNDGDLDWFVTAISDEDGVIHEGWGTSGNRLYQNQGDGTFIDMTDVADVRHGFWGWGSCFADFNNDGYLDIFHVNGFEGEGDIFLDDPSRLYISNRDGGFEEIAIESGIDDRGQGRGLACFDYDRDGDQDILVANHNEAPTFYCNHGSSNNYINVRLIDTSQNTQALGARIYIKTQELEQMRELRAGNNYVSQNPVEAHFGLASYDIVDELKIVWPDGEETIRNNIETNQFLIVTRNQID